MPSPQKGKPVAHLEGKRTGRPKGARTANRQAALPSSMKWVLDHIEDDPAEAKTPAVRAMLKWVQESDANRNKFMTKVMSMAFEKEEETEAKDAVVEPVLSLVDDLLKAWEDEKRPKKGKK
jgi:hypothetical protein